MTKEQTKGTMGTNKKLVVVVWKQKGKECHPTPYQQTNHEEREQKQHLVVSSLLDWSLLSKVTLFISVRKEFFPLY